MPETNVTNAVASAFGRVPARNANTNENNGDDAATIPAYVPTDSDKRRAKRRVQYALNVLKASPQAALAATLTIDGTLAASIKAARVKLAGLPKAERRDDVVRLARILLIDAQRMLSGYQPEV